MTTGFGQHLGLDGAHCKDTPQVIYSSFWLVEAGCRLNDSGACMKE